MKIIDLLNKIANGEEVPDEFKYDNLTFKKRWDNSYFDNEGDDLHESLCVDFSNLNDEIEILEEEKKIPEKLKILNANEHTKTVYYENYLKEEIALDIETLQNWVNDIIDYLYYLKNKGDE